VNSVSGKTFPTYDPTTENNIADVQEGDKVTETKSVIIFVNTYNNFTKNSYL